MILLALPIFLLLASLTTVYGEEVDLSKCLAPASHSNS